MTLIPPPSPLINKPTKYYISIHCYNTHYCLFTDHIYTHKHCINRNMLKHPRKGKIAQPCNFALTGEGGGGQEKWGVRNSITVSDWLKTVPRFMLNVCTIIVNAFETGRIFNLRPKLNVHCKGTSKPKKKQAGKHIINWQAGIESSKPYYKCFILHFFLNYNAMNEKKRIRSMQPNFLRGPLNRCSPTKICLLKRPN